MRKALKVGVIGYGSRAHTVCRYLCKLHHEVDITAVVDPREGEIKATNKTLSKERLTENFGKGYAGINWYPDPETMLEQAELDGVIIGTRCNTHTEIAIKVMEHNLPMYLEKPVSISLDQVKALYQASLKYSSEAVVSFPLKVSGFATISRELIEAGELGKVHQVQGINNVTYGSGYFSGHYRDFKETGGLWLQKATHDLDYISYLIGSRPERVAAMHSVNQVFGGDRRTGLTCDQCNQFESCPESPFIHYSSRSEDDVMANPKKLCAFGEDVGNLEDHSSCLIQYECGAQATYTQNFYIRRSPSRGVTIVGYDGNIQFDFGRGEVILTKHHQNKTLTYAIGGSDGHGGGDSILANNFVQIMRGTHPSRTTLLSGIESAYLCLLCRQSAEAGRFPQVESLGELK